MMEPPERQLKPATLFQPCMLASDFIGSAPAGFCDGQLWEPEPEAPTNDQLANGLSEEAIVAVLKMESPFIDKSGCDEVSWEDVPMGVFMSLTPNPMATCSRNP